MVKTTNMFFFDFPYILGMEKIPTDFHSLHDFSEGLAATTNQIDG